VEGYSPWDQLPMPEPKTVDYPFGYFYEHTAKYIIKDAVRLMDNGLNVDLEKVIALEGILAEQLGEVTQELANNVLIKTYLEKRHANQIKEYIKDRKSKMRKIADYLGPFKYKDMNHRSYFMDEYAKTRGWSSPSDKLPTGVGKWPANLVKKYAKQNRLLQLMLAGNLPESTPVIDVAMKRLAKDKAKMYNEKYLAQVKTPNVSYPVFNPASPLQKQELFEMLGIESDKTSKDTGQPSWDRDSVERVNNETADEDIKQFTQCFIDHSFAAIVKNNFIEAFYTYTVEGRLYGQYKTLGAKSGRFTSSNPNMLNCPSTKSRFAKPIKRCFTAPEGFVIGAIDYAALEDRVMANLSKDTNKLGLFLEDLDGHSLSATYYYPDRVAAIIGPFTDNKLASIELKKLVDEGNKEAKQIRQDAKPISFGLAYGAYPKKVANTIKIPLEQAEAIFNAYHQDMYPGITSYRENYVLVTAKEHGRVHLGLGFYINSDDPERDIRTLNNSTCQFWSILTALAINKLHQLIDDAGLEKDVIITSTIYDSIYLEIRDTPEIIKWVNDRIVPVMEQDFMEEQIVHNSADLELGKDWSDLYTLPHNASITQIQKVRNNF